MKGERDAAGSSPQILYVPVLILARENTASWRKRSDLVVGLLQLSTKISVFSSLFELRGFKHRGRVLYLCLGLNRPPVVFSRRCGRGSEHQPSNVGWENWELLTDLNTHTKMHSHTLSFRRPLPLSLFTLKPQTEGKSHHTVT